jgi:hypothetical protein
MSKRDRHPVSHRPDRAARAQKVECVRVESQGAGNFDAFHPDPVDPEGLDKEMRPQIENAGKHGQHDDLEIARTEQLGFHRSQPPS